MLRPAEASATEVSRETCRVAGAELEAGKERREMWGPGGVMKALAETMGSLDSILTSLAADSERGTVISALSW